MWSWVNVLTLRLKTSELKLSPLSIDWDWLIFQGVKVLISGSLGIRFSNFLKDLKLRKIGLWVKFNLVHSCPSNNLTSINQLSMQMTYHLLLCLWPKINWNQVDKECCFVHLDLALYVVLIDSVRINLPLFSTVLPSNSCCFCPVGLSLL